ncbi:MAG: hypothetical protein IJI37_06615, partial [Opitutales bacterium]|nr:hypothetical protein [Opitutales bacterium]
FFSLICGFTKTIKTHEQIDRYVAMLKKQGFNALRWRFLMDNEFESPYKLKPLNRDLYDYFLYALGREGIYSFFYLCSHDTGDPSFTWNDRFTVKVKMMLGDPATREAWRKLAKMQLEHVNPYTGKKWKDDPSIATIEYWNEFELGISSYPSITEEGKKLAREKFGEYLAKRYKTPADFLADCEKMGTPWKQETAPRKFSDIDLSPYDNRTGNPVYARFIVEAMTDMQAFCEKVVREEIGMKIPTHQNNCVRSSFWAYLSSIGGDYTAINVYHCHPSSYSLGAQVPQKSSIADEASYWRASAAKRVAGMPLAITEYQHCYFNKYVHELGVLFSSYAALQGYGALVEFDSPVAENPAKFGFFGIGTNPIMRANDFLTYFLFYRGDVKASPHRTELVLDKNFIENGTTLQLGVNQEQSKIALMTGFALSFPDGRKLNPACGAGLKPADLKLAPIGGTEINTSQNFASAGKTFDKGFKTRDILPALKGKGILPEGNVSDPDNGVFQSDTGEIVLRAKSREMSVAAEKSAVAVVNEDTKSQTLGAFRINSFNRKGAVGIVSIDGEPLEKSSRMVLVISTDSVPTGVGLSSTRLKIISWGKPPALIETGALSAALKVGEGRRFDIYPLKISGERLEKIPAKVEGGELKLEIDTSKNPSLYFEIVESKGGE